MGRHASSAIVAIPEQGRDAPIGVVVLGMAARQVSLLEMVFAGPGGNCCAVVPDELAQACIVDMDSAGAVEEVLRQRQLHPKRPMVLTGVQPPPESVMAGDQFVPKPIQVDVLVEVIAALGRRVRAARATRIPADITWPGTDPQSLPKNLRPGPAQRQDGGLPTGSQRTPAPEAASREVVAPEVAGPGTPDVPVAVRSRAIRVATAEQATGEVLPQGEEVLPQGETVTGSVGVPAAGISSYEPVRYLQGLVNRARREGLRRGCAVYLEGPWPTITLLPACGTAVVVGGAGGLRPYSPQYDLPSQGRVTFTPAPLFSPNHPDAVDLEVLIWELALGASAGRVPEGTQPGGACALEDWPDFTRLAPTPGATSIAALWTRQAITLEETARTVGVPLREVCSFYSAAHAVGLITPPTRIAPAAPATQSGKPSPRRGLLRWVFNTP